MSLVGMTFRYRALPDVRIRITKVEHFDSHSVFHYEHLDRTKLQAHMIQDRFNKHFIEVKA
tara:strand:- start:151 stop:333 length:183 start_codon:yes stop_codon:yes gene_type:complete